MSVVLPHNGLRERVASKRLTYSYDPYCPSGGGRALSVEFRACVEGNRRCEAFTWCGAGRPAVGEFVVVETERGYDVGRVTAQPAALAPERCVVRVAHAAEVRRWHELERWEAEAAVNVQQVLTQMGVAYDVAYVEAQWDKCKLTVYYTVAGNDTVDHTAVIPHLYLRYRMRIVLTRVS